MPYIEISVSTPDMPVRGLMTYAFTPLWFRV